MQKRDFKMGPSKRKKSSFRNSVRTLFYLTKNCLWDYIAGFNHSIHIFLVSDEYILRENRPKKASVWEKLMPLKSIFRYGARDQVWTGTPKGWSLSTLTLLCYPRKCSNVREEYMNTKPNCQIYFLQFLQD